MENENLMDVDERMFPVSFFGNSTSSYRPHKNSPFHTESSFAQKYYENQIIEFFNEHFGYAVSLAFERKYLPHRIGLGEIPEISEQPKSNEIFEKQKKIVEIEEDIEIIEEVFHITDYDIPKITISNIRSLKG